LLRIWVSFHIRASMRFALGVIPENFTIAGFRYWSPPR